MSYAKLEAKIRADALQDLSSRAAKLSARLDEVGSVGDAPGFELERELRYLERMATAAPPSDSRGALAAQIARLRRRFDGLVRSEAARAAHAASADRGDRSFDGLAFSGQERPQAPLDAPAAAARRGDRSPDSPQRSQAPRAAPGTAAESGDHSPRSPQRSQDSFGERGVVTPVASFLRPRQTPDESEDEVRLMSAEGRLAQELQRFPMLSVPGTESTLVFRRLKSWSDLDDAESRQRERLAVLELSQAAANLREMQTLVQQHIAQDQEQFDHIEQHVAETRSRTSEVVVTLASARSERERTLVWLAPSVGLVILGGGIVAVAPAAAAGCVACAVVRGSLTMGALGLHFASAQKLKQWQQRALESLTDHLPRAFDSLPSEEVHILKRAGDEAQRRLLAKLRDKASWSQFYGSAAAIFKGLRVFCRESDSRKGGYAFHTTFTAKRIRAREAFDVVRQLSIAGSLDPGCEVAWSRPLSDEEEATSLRYLIFCNKFSSRDFYCVCRCTQEAVEADGSPEPPAERFVFAVASLAPELLASTGLPKSNKDLEHGSIHVSGIIVSDDGRGGSLVQVMGDVDPVHGWAVPTWVVDSEVRLHVLRTAQCLAKEMARASEEQRAKG